MRTARIVRRRPRRSSACADCAAGFIIARNAIIRYPKRRRTRTAKRAEFEPASSTYSVLNKTRRVVRRRRAKLTQSARLDSQPKGPLPDDEQAALLEQNQELIEQLTRVTRERDRALQELEFAQRAVQPRPVGPDHPSRCSVCLKR